MAIIDEQSLPARPLEAEVVLHVRNLLYRQLRTEPTGAALGLLFGLSEEECARFDVDRAVRSRNPVATLAEAIAKSRESERAVVSLPSDGDYVEQCRQWLLHRKNEAPRVFDSIVATDLATLLALSRARDAATTADLLGGEDLPEVPILITGETGTGKELLARAIHTLWVAADPARRGRALEILFVAGMSRDQVNDEIFGHIRGAYTGATTDRPGRLEEADGTTLLIDEVGDLSPEAQVRLLRFLDRGEASRLGSNKTRRFKVRVIGATLRNLAQEVNDGRFRRDLFFRLRGVQIKLPPLRQRSGGFDEVVSTLLQRIRPNVTPQLTRSARSALRAYNWPGNLRELRQVLNSAVASAAGEIRSLPVLRGVEAVEEFGTIFRFMARSAMSLPAEFRSQIRSAIHERRGLRGSATRQSKGSGRLHFGAARYDRERACAYALAEVRAARVSPRSARPG